MKNPSNSSEMSTPLIDLRTEAEDGLWGAGAEALTETVRDFLVNSMASDLPESEQVEALRVLRNVFQTKTGTVIVAAVSGGIVYMGQVYDVDFPFVEKTMVARLGREFRVLAVRSGGKALFDKAIGPFRDVAVHKFGGLLRGLADSARHLQEAKGVRARSATAPTPDPASRE